MYSYYNVSLFVFHFDLNMSSHGKFLYYRGSILEILTDLLATVSIPEVLASGFDKQDTLQLRRL